RASFHSYLHAKIWFVFLSKYSDFHQWGSFTSLNSISSFKYCSKKGFRKKMMMELGEGQPLDVSTISLPL
ncbi:MAG TPA: hypothetical protein VGQ59_09070, partial [Cyclobacteriaceae bacterium]|nr:hypothetical protein [Cyclobacteriaceae bacterium]